jgi:hypothetical protein
MLLKPYILDEPKDDLFRYCKREHFKEFFSKGKIRLSSADFYRKNHDPFNPGFSDPDELTETAFIGNLKVSASINKFLLCLSKKYQFADHKKWFERQDCRYDYCLRIHAPTLFKILYDHLNAITLENLEFCRGSVRYGKLPQSDVQKLSGNLALMSFRKPSSYSWENEYRVAVQIPSSLMGRDHFELVIPNFSDCILDGIPLISE